MTEIDYLKCKLEDTEKAFDKLHKRHIELLKQQGKLEKENEQLRECYKDCKKMLSEAIDENELLECKEGVYNVHHLKKDYEQLKEENEQLRTRLQDVLAELYCKDRKLEELGVPIECCDTNE